MIATPIAQARNRTNSSISQGSTPHPYREGVTTRQSPRVVPPATVLRRPPVRPPHPRRHARLTRGRPPATRGPGLFRHGVAALTAPVSCRAQQSGAVPETGSMETRSSAAAVSPPDLQWARTHWPSRKPSSWDAVATKQSPDAAGPPTHTCVALRTVIGPRSGSLIPPMVCGEHPIPPMSTVAARLSAQRADHSRFLAGPGEDVRQP
jgi:hypothetical protein